MNAKVHQIQLTAWSNPLKGTKWLSFLALAAPLKQHVECILHATVQVCAAAGHEQGAEAQGGRDTLLVDVSKQVLLVLVAQDDLCVVVVEVHLIEEWLRLGRVMNGDPECIFVFLSLE